MMKTTSEYLYVPLICLMNVHLAKCFMNSNEVTLPQGRVKGTLMSQNWPYFTFFGIPYASSPERFQEPGDPPSWIGTLEANRGTIECTQYSSTSGKTIGQEDCLVVNIYTPVNTDNEPLPVIAFIPGGGFSHGSNSNNSYDGRFLVRKKVVLVTINYRIGAFGFLCLRNKAATGNMGIKDQIAALRWINNNIVRFGGDPNRVTLYGQSAGSISVAYLLFTNAAKGLFQRAIMSSGALLAPHSYDGDPVKTASTAALRLGFKTSDSEQLGLIYKNADAEDLAQLYNINITTALDLYVFRPCSEDSRVSEQAVVTESILSLFRVFRVDPSINIITGFLNEEGMKWASAYDSLDKSVIENSISTLVPYNFEFKTKRDKTLYVNEVKKFYFKSLSAHDRLYDQMVDFMTDIMIIYPEVLTAEAFLRSNNTMFNYFFTFDSDRNAAKLFESKYPMKPGAGHGDDLYYIFDTHEVPLPISPIDRVVINALTAMWSNFARTGVPSINGIFPWRESKNTLNFLNIDRIFKMISLPYEDRIRFWKKIHKKYSVV